MATHWTLSSIPPHDFYLCLDIESYFDHEHDPTRIVEEGFTRPIPLEDRDIGVTVHFNGDPEDPEFSIETEENLSEEELEMANRSLHRILGTRLDLRPLYKKAGNDSVLGPLLTEFYGLKRMSRANIFEDAVNRIVQTRLSHKPTAKKMVYKVREQYAPLLEANGQSIAGWPRPHQMATADPSQIRKLGPTLRKGEYIVDLANAFLSGELDMAALEQADPMDFYNTISGVRGIGPTSAQNLMLFRETTEGAFPSHYDKDKEKGLRRYIILSYGGDPEQTTEVEFNDLIRNWAGYEAAAIEFLYIKYVVNEKKREQEEY